jgi:hypothetical protein
MNPSRYEDRQLDGGHDDEYYWIRIIANLPIPPSYEG